MDSVISIRGITKRFRGCDALDGVSFEVPSGVVFALLGENGAGKTTLIKILTGFLAADAGRAEVLGMDCVKEALEIRRRIGYVSDQPAMYDWMRVEEIGWFTSRAKTLLLGLQLERVEKCLPRPYVRGLVPLLQN